MLYYKHKEERHTNRQEDKDMMSKETERLWDTLVEYGVATDEELGLACVLCGVSEHTLLQVLYVRTGYRNVEQWLDEDEEE